VEGKLEAQMIEKTPVRTLADYVEKKDRPVDLVRGIQKEHMYRNLFNPLHIDQLRSNQTSWVFHLTNPVNLTVSAVLHMLIEQKLIMKAAWLVSPTDIAVKKAPDVLSCSLQWPDAYEDAFRLVRESEDLPPGFWKVVSNLRHVTVPKRVSRQNQEPFIDFKDLQSILYRVCYITIPIPHLQDLLFMIAWNAELVCKKREVHWLYVYYEQLCWDGNINMDVSDVAERLQFDPLFVKERLIPTVLKSIHPIDLVRSLVLTHDYIDPLYNEFMKQLTFDVYDILSEACLPQGTMLWIKAITQNVGTVCKSLSTLAFHYTHTSIPAKSRVLTQLAVRFGRPDGTALNTKELLWCNTMP
tara:strand:+ start:4950 stop:6014 length:1065 start_codon:yes stop_codon:yes gene_type:complete